VGTVTLLTPPRAYAERISIDLHSATDAGLPKVIQGGMGVGVSNWQLACAVSLAGQLGVVSGTAINTMLVRRH